MNVPQLTVTSAAARASRRARRAPSVRIQPKPDVTASSPPRKTSDHATRWARISTGAAGSSSGQKRGMRPHSRYAATAAKRPERWAGTHPKLATAVLAKRAQPGPGDRHGVLDQDRARRLGMLAPPGRQRQQATLQHLRRQLERALALRRVAEQPRARASQHLDQHRLRLRVALARRRPQLLVDRPVAVEQRLLLHEGEERVERRPQARLAAGHLCRAARDSRRQLTGLALEQVRVEAALGVEVVVEDRRADPRTARDLVHADGAVAALREEALRHLGDLLAALGRRHPGHLARAYLIAVRSTT